MPSTRPPDMQPPTTIPDFAFDADFRSSEDAFGRLKQACETSTWATFHVLGESEEGRPVAGVVLGRDASPDGGGALPRTVSLIAGNHADEPVGPLTLRHWVLDAARRPEAWAPLLQHFRFVIVPHTNPDGEARNRPWMQEWPDLVSFLKHRVREQPGRDLEFGFPAMRQENRVVSAFLEEQAPPEGYALHASLHGMAFAEGAQLLIERHWGFRTEALRRSFREAAREANLGLHDHNRFGEKGFFYLGPGFNTTPEGAAMRAFFHAQGDETMAQRFHQSSMEFVRARGGDPLCLVTELPLFAVPASEGSHGRPQNYLKLRDALPEWTLRAERGEEISEAVAQHGLRPVPVGQAVRLQRRALALGLEAVRA